MKNIQLSFNNVKEYAKIVFDKALVNDLTPLQKVKEFQKELKGANPHLEEMFTNDFAYEINIHQAKHFLKTGTLLLIDNSIPTIASVWILAWANAAIKSVKKLGIDKSFDFRKYPFKDTKYAVDKLSMIFEHVFENDEKHAIKVGEIKDDVIPSYNFYKPTDQCVRNSFVDIIYRLAALQTFGSYLKDQENIWEQIIQCYYGKYKKENDDLFGSTPYKIKNPQAKADKVKEMKQLKEQELCLRDEDIYYWKYFVSLEKNESFLSALSSEIDFDKEIIAKNFYIKNNYDIMQKEIVLDVNKKLIKKIVKI
jgi:hypothetical protein